jgi:nicotinamide N-methyltransferase
LGFYCSNAGIEIGAGSGFVSLCAAISKQPPKLVLVTDYPDHVILGNLKSSVEANRHLISDKCDVKVNGYAWASDPSRLLSYIPDSGYHESNLVPGGLNARSKGFDIMVLSDLLYFDQSHNELIRSIQDLLARNSEARVYVAAGKYTPANVCQSFLDKGARADLQWEEVSISQKWEGRDPGGTYTVDALESRKQNSRLWIGRWDFSSS